MNAFWIYNDKKNVYVSKIVSGSVTPISVLPKRKSVNVVMNQLVMVHLQKRKNASVKHTVNMATTQLHVFYKMKKPGVFVKRIQDVTHQHVFQIGIIRRI
jgi:hypothetical protein